MSVTTAGVWRRSRFWGGIVLLVLVLIVIGLANRMFIFIGPGEQGVLWSRFFGGTVMDRVYDEGFHTISPWNRMYVYNVRVQEIHGDAEVLSNNGLRIGVKWSARFRARRNLDLPMLHKDIGPDYGTAIARPEVIAAIRRVLGNYTPEEIYSTDELKLLQEMMATLTDEFHQKYLEFDDVLIQELTLPEQVAKAINDKLEQQHLAASFVFRLERERQERDRKQIEAEGIAAFQRVSGISILNWRGIEATVELAKSPNTKIVILGTDSQSLPIILNTER